MGEFSVKRGLHFTLFSTLSENNCLFLGFKDVTVNYAILVPSVPSPSPQTIEERNLPIFTSKEQARS